MSRQQAALTEKDFDVSLKLQDLKKEQKQGEKEQDILKGKIAELQKQKDDQVKENEKVKKSLAQRMEKIEKERDQANAAVGDMKRQLDS